MTNASHFFLGIFLARHSSHPTRAPKGTRACARACRSRSPRLDATMCAGPWPAGAPLHLCVRRSIHTVDTGAAAHILRRATPNWTQACALAARLVASVISKTPRPMHATMILANHRSHNMPANNLSVVFRRSSATVEGDMSAAKPRGPKAPSAFSHR